MSVGIQIVNCLNTLNTVEHKCPSNYIVKFPGSSRDPTLNENIWNHKFLAECIDFYIIYLMSVTFQSLN